jgi:hypothetical protein
MTLIQIYRKAAKAAKERKGFQLERGIYSARNLLASSPHQTNIHTPLPSRPFATSAPLR